eukprot:NODE_2774_length_542_cov_144.513185_g2390_i0.p2 GENE.NODE_2774_length_542_cov_144.513185_g2390_i0~~NODE_2774_length_542_cov_144.513185_g2390_i0.p2  ORF type:complete len:107 (+),score=19.90 NODE_2774_length_542_cov_144.513185_g2390_i0:24-323(+)
MGEESFLELSAGAQLLADQANKRPVNARYTSHQEFMEKRKKHMIEHEPNTKYSTPITTAMEHGFMQPPSHLGRPREYFPKSASEESRYQTHLIKTGQAV